MGCAGAIQIKSGSCQAALHVRTHPGEFAAPATCAVSGAALTPATPAPPALCTGGSLIWIDSYLERQSMQQCALCAAQMRHACNSNPCNHAICVTHRCHMPLYATNSKAHAMSWPLEFSCATCDTKRTHLRLQLMLRLSTGDTYTGSLRAVQSCRQKEGATIITHTADESSNAILGLKCISLPASCIESLVQQNRQITVQWHWRRTPPAKHRRTQPHPG